MTLGNIGAAPTSQKLLNKGWSTLKDYAHSALTHFSKSDEPSEEESDTPTRWGILPADVMEHKRDIEVRFEVPGMAKEDLKVEFVHGHLVVRGEKRMSRSRQEGGCHTTERAFGHFQRAITMPTPIQADAAKAKYEDGVLVVTVPKEANPSRSSIAIG